MNWITEEQVKEAAARGWEAALDMSILKYRQWAGATLEEVLERYCEDCWLGDLCALCKKAGRCKECIVFAKTKISDCRSTPYEKAMVILIEGIETEDDLAAFRVACQEEINFLESLRPMAQEWDRKE